MSKVYLLTQTDSMMSDSIRYRRHSHVVAAYTDLVHAQRDMAVLGQDAIEFNIKLADSDVTVTFPGDSNVYYLTSRSYSLEECPLH